MVLSQGITTDWQRSHDASLARTLHRRTRSTTGQPSVQAKAHPTTHPTAQASTLASLGALTGTLTGPNQLDRLLSRTASTQDFITLLLGVSPAHAAEPPKSAQTKTTPPDAQTAQQPGALSLPPDPAALLDTRYLWSPQGWLLHTQRQGAALHTPNTGTTANNTERQTQAYNRAGQLLASVRSTGTPESASQDTTLWRYAWQPRTQQRLLAQQVQGSTKPQEELHQGTTASRFDAQGRLAAVQSDQNTTAMTYNANGQPEQVSTPQGPRRYGWDALGRLTQVSQGDNAEQLLARYACGHRGLRTLAPEHPIASDLRRDLTDFQV